MTLQSEREREGPRDRLSLVVSVTYRLDAEPRELRNLVSRGPWAVGVPSAARALLPGPRGSLNTSKQGSRECLF